MKLFKVKAREGMAETFEDWMIKNNIGFRKYPNPIKDTYRVECNLFDIVDAGFCIESLEDMPTITLG